MIVIIFNIQNADGNRPVKLRIFGGNFGRGKESLKYWGNTVGTMGGGIPRSNRIVTNWPRDAIEFSPFTDHYPRSLFFIYLFFSFIYSL